MRMTDATVRVAISLSEEPFGRHWGYDLQKRAHVRSGVMYPILQRMLEEGWLYDGWEDPAEIDGKRPPRRYYTLTDKGRTGLGLMLTEARADARFCTLPWAGVGL